MTGSFYYMINICILNFLLSPRVQKRLEPSPGVRQDEAAGTMCDVEGPLMPRPDPSIPRPPARMRWPSGTCSSRRPPRNRWPSLGHLTIPCPPSHPLTIPPSQPLAKRSVLEETDVSYLSAILSYLAEVSAITLQAGPVLATYGWRKRELRSLVQHSAPCT